MIYYPAPETLAASLPDAGGPLASFFVDAGKQFLWPAELVASICFRESLFGEALSPRGPGGTGDWDPPSVRADGSIGHGRGLMQIDDRPHSELGTVAVSWLAQLDGKGQPLWKDPQANITFGAFVLATGRAMLDWSLAKDAGIVAHVAAYNADLRKVANAVRGGADPDLLTTGKNYAADVLAKACTWHALSKNGNPCDCVLCAFNT